jgi:hypothetical protein
MIILIFIENKKNEKDQNDKIKKKKKKKPSMGFTLVVGELRFVLG